MENTFWNISRDGNFLETFKKSFALYVDSGMGKKVEAQIDILRNEQGGRLATNDFKERFFKFIVDHYLRKIRVHCFYTHSTHLTALIQPTPSPILGFKLLCWNEGILKN